MRLALLLALFVAGTAVEAADATPTASASSAPTSSAGLPGETVFVGPRTGPDGRVGLRRAARRGAPADISVLGSVKLLRAEEGRARLRIDGAEQTLRPGMFLKTDRVRSIAPERIVLVRPAEADDAKGETLVIIDVLAGGRTRVRMYATRNWTAPPPDPVE